MFILTRPYVLFFDDDEYARARVPDWRTCQFGGVDPEASAISSARHRGGFIIRVLNDWHQEAIKLVNDVDTGDIQCILKSRWHSLTVMEFVERFMSTFLLEGFASSMSAAEAEASFRAAPFNVLPATFGGIFDSPPSLMAVSQACVLSPTLPALSPFCVGALAADAVLS